VNPVGQDLKYGARLLAKAPAFSVVALVALALGIGATTAIFSVVDAVLLKPLPFRDPDRLIVIYERNPVQHKDKLFVAGANYLEWQRQSRVWEGMAAVQEVHANLTGGPGGHLEPEELKVERVSAGLFPVLGVQAVVGRTFRPEEDQPGHSRYVLLSHRLWRRLFGEDRSLVGNAVRLRGESYTVVGVLPPDFAVLEPAVDAWIPLGLDAGDARGLAAHNVTVIARLKPGAAFARAQAEMETIGRRLEQSNPALNRGSGPSLYTLENELVGDVRKPLLVLLGAVGFLMLMACANVANLLLARGAGRRREIAVRAAMGAGRGRILAQLLCESLMLALAGGLVGLVLARASVALLGRLGEAGIPRLANAGVDARLFAFALCLSLATGILFGLAPALQLSAGSLRESLTEGGRGGTTTRPGRALRDSLVVSEVALAVLVLIGACLLMRSYLRLRAVDPGFQPSGLLTFRLPLGGTRYAAPERRIAFFQQVVDRLAALPGVRAVAAANGLPLTGLGAGSTFAVEGQPPPPPEHRPLGLARSINPGYFRAMGIPLVAGREFAASDTGQSPPVMMVSRSLARRFWSDGHPLGGRIALDYPARTAEIVGVVENWKADRLDGEDWPTLYYPYAQAPVNTMTLALRTAGPPLALASAVGRAVHQLDPDQVVAEVRPMEAVVDESVAGARFQAVVLDILGLIAFSLCAVGVYGVISYSVIERTHEIGIRVALGAQSGDVLLLVLGHGARLAAIGIAAGLAAALALTRLMASMLYGVKPTDFYSFAAISALLGIVALAASYLPSRRAMRLDPVAALRHE